MSCRVASWDRVPSSPGHVARIWATVAKGGRSQTRPSVESIGGSAAARNQHRLDAQVDGLRQGFGFQTRSWPIFENDRWEGGSVGRELIQRVSRFLPGGVSHGMGKPALTAMTLVPKAKSTSVFLLEEVKKEVEHNEVVFLELGLIGRFIGRWPSLGDLHKWISVNWETLVEDYVQIYPHARGLFVVVFQSVVDRNKVLGSGH
ncbi:hypothetical protein SUGI_0832820 [Cryptomeria japonica]|nr:hypothetical protein SUGI_0832820 [Cryptomeria japonica]